MEEHKKTLKAVLHRAVDFVITFEELDFYGHKFTKDRLKPNPEKIRAEIESSPPKLKEAVRSFLGVIRYLSKLIPRYASLISPLRKVTHKDTNFKWGAEEKKHLGWHTSTQIDQSL